VFLRCLLLRLRLFYGRLVSRRCRCIGCGTFFVIVAKVAWFFVIFLAFSNFVTFAMKGILSLLLPSAQTLFLYLCASPHFYNLSLGHDP